MAKMFQTLPLTNSKSKQTASKMGECLSQSYMHSWGLQFSESVLLYHAGGKDAEKETKHK
jgi:hypothetical protein